MKRCLIVDDSSVIRKVARRILENFGFTVSEASDGRQALDPDADAAGFKAWLQDVARTAAEAGKEGGFMGFGGVAVSDAERATLAEISSALGTSGAAPA